MELAPHRVADCVTAVQCNDGIRVVFLIQIVIAVIRKDLKSLETGIIFYIDL